MRRRLIKVAILIVSLAGATILQAQTESVGRISGHLFDKKTLKPVVGASVTVVGTKKGAVSDFEGAFTILWLNPGKYNLTISSLIFKTLNLDSIIVVADSTTEIKQYLIRDTTRSDNVITINGRQNIIDKFSPGSPVVISQEQNATPLDTITDTVPTDTTPLESSKNNTTISRLSISQEQIKARPVTTVDELLEQGVGRLVSGQPRCSTIFIRDGRKPNHFRVDSIPIDSELIDTISTEPLTLSGYFTFDFESEGFFDTYLLDGVISAQGERFYIVTENKYLFEDPPPFASYEVLNNKGKYFLELIEYDTLPRLFANRINSFDVDETTIWEDGRLLVKAFKSPQIYGNVVKTEKSNNVIDSTSVKTLSSKRTFRFISVNHHILDGYYFYEVTSDQGEEYYVVSERQFLFGSPPPFPRYEVISKGEEYQLELVEYENTEKFSKGLLYDVYYRDKQYWKDGKLAVKVFTSPQIYGNVVKIDK